VLCFRPRRLLAAISREHYIMEGVLKLIGDPITVAGFPWQDGKERTIGTKALTSKIYASDITPLWRGLIRSGLGSLTSCGRRDSSYPRTE